MLAITQKILSEKMDAVILRIQDNIRNKKVTRFGAMNASGRTAASLHYEFRDNGVYLYGAGHIFTLEFGRGPTVGGASPTPLRDRIRVWIDEKGIIPKPGANGKAISKDSLAYLIARKIHNEGTLLHKQAGNSGILSDVINPETEQDFIDALFFEFETVVTNQLMTA